MVIVLFPPPSFLGDDSTLQQFRIGDCRFISIDHQSVSLDSEYVMVERNAQFD